MQIPRSSVVAQSLPCFHDPLWLRACNVVEGGEAIEKLTVASDHARHLRLLKHQLRNEDLVRIACLAPWKVARVPPVPGSKLLRESHPRRRIDRHSLTDSSAAQCGVHRGSAANSPCAIPWPARKRPKATVAIPLASLRYRCIRPNRRAVSA